MPGRSADSGFQSEGVEDLLATESGVRLLGFGRFDGGLAWLVPSPADDRGGGPDVFPCFFDEDAWGLASLKAP